MKSKYLPICFVLCLIACNAFAKADGVDTAQLKPKLKKFYVGSGFDGGLFSTATIQHTYPVTVGGPNTPATNTTGTLRFSYFINIGVTFNFNLSRHFGLYTGVDLKNIGYIDKENGLTVKRRTYNIGAPIGIKIGNMMPKKAYAFFGGGADVPINFKIKAFSDRSEKTKSNQWFSDQTPHVMPYVFAGLAINHGITFKAQYYPNNFLNPDYTVNGVEPYNGMEVHLILFSIGYVIPVGDHDMVRKHIDDLKAK